MQVGLIRPDVFKELLKYPEVFFIKDVREGDSEVFFKAFIRYGKMIKKKRMQKNKVK